MKTNTLINFAFSEGFWDLYPIWAGAPDAAFVRREVGILTWTVGRKNSA